MANGFIGNASKAYFNTVQEASQNSRGTMAATDVDGNSGRSLGGEQSYARGTGFRTGVAVNGSSQRFFDGEQSYARGTEFRTSVAVDGSGGLPSGSGLSYPTGTGLRTNIAVDDDLYAVVLRQIEQANEDMERALRDVITEIRAMCQSEFVIPDTVLRVRATIGAVEQTLGAFRDITSQAASIMRNFVAQIDASDHG